MKKSNVFACLFAAFATTLMGFSCGDPSGPSTGTITVTAPVAAKKLLAGDTVTVTWTPSVASPKFAYNYNLGGSAWQDFAAVIPVDGQSSKVVLPLTSYSDSFQIKVEDNSGANNPGTSPYFAVKYLVITSPVANESHKVGDTVTIRWKDVPDRFSTLRVMLSTDGGMSFADMLTLALDPSETQYVWIIGSEPGAVTPFVYPSTQCAIQIQDYRKDYLNDITGLFSITQ